MIIGVIAAVVSMVVLQLIPYEKRNDILAVLLAGIAGIYVGFALMDGHTVEIVIESIAAAAFILVALFGRWKSAYYIGAGFILHGVWDWLHHAVIDTKVVNGYPDFCAIYDIIVGAYCLVYCFVKARGKAV